MPRRKVLFVCHNHPDLLVGGVEMYTRALYEALEGTDFEPMILARAGRPFSATDTPHADSPLTMVNRDPNQYLLYTDFSDFDYFNGRLSTTKEVLSRSFADYLRYARPDVVHFEHTAYIGYDIVRVTRNTLPDVPIVYSLHEYLPICHRDGQMLRTGTDQLCQEESPRRCHECFPEITPQDFYMRKRFAQSHLAQVDQFLVPSEYVKERYVQWGLPEWRVQVLSYCFPRPETSAEDIERKHEPEGTTLPRNRFAYFGQLNPYKGADVMLRAMDVLGEDFDGHLSIYGANLEKQSAEWRKRFGELADVERSTVTFVGSYDRAELPQLLARTDWVLVPSIWWETGPIVVIEAFQHGRPVICSDIGGMSEKVTDGVNGMHFRTGDPEHLAGVMQTAVESPGLWDELRAGIPDWPESAMDDHIRTLTGVYDRLLLERRPAAVPLEEVAST